MHKAPFAAIGVLTMATPAHAAWDFKLVDGPLGDGKVGVATLAGEQGDLVVRCDTTGRNSLFLTVRPKVAVDRLQSDFMRPLAYRIDGGPPRTANAIYDADEVSVVNLVRGLMGGDLVFAMLPSKTLALELTDSTRRSYTLTFKTEGARAAILQAASACADTNWTSLPR